jgi:cell wall-associated NlpC family hydrolase
MNRPVLTALLCALVPFLLALGVAPPSHAAPDLAGDLPARSLAADGDTLSPALRALRVASNQAGDPYRWGAAGPNAFDCSGLTSFSFRRAGREIPRTAAAQRRATRHIARRDRRRGDLVFFHGSNGVYHVGIYAGSNQMWHAQKTGTRVHKATVWSGWVSYGRVR